MKNFSQKKRRGLSSIVGALLFVVLMVAAFAVLGVALDSQTDIVSTGREVADTGLKKQQENFKISSIVQNPGGNLQINVTNSGQNPSEIFTLVITNSSDIGNGYPTKTFDIPSNTSFLAPNSEIPTDIVKTLNLQMSNNPGTEIYQFKIVSSLGNIQKLFVACTGGACGLTGGGGGTFDLFAQLLLDGPNGVNTKVSTAVMFVTNVGSSPLYDVAPVTACSKGAMFGVAPDTLGTADFNPCDLEPTSIDELLPGQTAIFKWDGLVTGEVGDVFTFQNFARGYDDEAHTNPPIDSNSDIDTLEVIDPNDCGGCDEGGGDGEANDNVIILDDLLIRPSILLTMPSPFGMSTNANDLGVWGVNIANPTNSTMDVSKVVITAFAPGAQENTIVFDDGAGNNQNINPPGAGLGDWDLSSENVMVWRNFGSPITLDPYTNESFLIKVKPEEKNLLLESIIVQASVFTTSGSFGKAGYQTTMFKENISGTGCKGCNPIANVYLSDALDSRDNANILAHRDDLKNGTQYNFLVTFADMDVNANSAIVEGAKIIINVPRDWENVDVFNNSTNVEWIPNADPELASPSIKKHGDGTWQIIATTDTHLGNSTNPDTATVSFTAKTPEKFAENMHIMYVLGNGISQTGHSVGPLSEVVLHVIGNVTGYP